MPAASFPDVSDATRKVMKANKGKDTKPEMVVRRLVHGLGYRYRLHRSALPGSPDLVFPSRRKAIFVHGCFWHAHDAEGCRLRGRPKTRTSYWEAKFARNRLRDERDVAALRALGWEVLVVWECGLKDINMLRDDISAFLDGYGTLAAFRSSPGVTPEPLASGVTVVGQSR